MKIRDIIRPELVLLDLQATSKEEVLKELAQQLQKHHVVADAVAFLDVIWQREAQGTTGIGEGIAIPHGKSKLVQQPTIVFGRSIKGIDFDALDGQPAHLFFMIATPDDADDTHLQMLSALSVQLMKAEVKQGLFAAQSAADVLKIFERGGEAEAAVQKADSNRPFVIAVTACATGIAHTYMAAEKLKEAGTSLGVEIKVETNGATGIDNRLTVGDIQRAAGVIVAADIKVETSRFDGKSLVSVPVAEGIRKPEELIKRITEHKATIHREDATAEVTQGSESMTLGKQIYKHLLSGVSHMLPFVVGGGIAIALAFLVDQIIGVPTEELANLGSYNEYAAYLMTIGGAAFGFMLPVLAGYIAYSMADRPGLVVGFVAGGIASTGGAGFLGALLGGFLAGAIVNVLKRVLQKLPKSLDGIKTILFYPVFGVLIVGALMLILNIPMRAINEGLNEFLNGLSGANAVVLGALLGAMMAIDLGGPINKSAYIFATGTLAATVATGGSSVMAAVMAAGMVPPLAVFFATLLFKTKFQQSEREAGMTNLILGASFITEGAIPFAAADPVRMIPSFVVGSAVTGALVLLTNIKVMAPHGGIFVLPLVSQPLVYIALIIVGAFVSALCIGMVKKTVND